MYRNIIKIFRDYKICSGTLSRIFVNNQYSTAPKTISYLRRRQKDIPLLGWLLLVVTYSKFSGLIIVNTIFQSVPVGSFSLGVWQIQRKQWKESLIEDLRKKTDCDPVDFPTK